LLGKIDKLLCKEEKKKEEEVWATAPHLSPRVNQRLLINPRRPALRLSAIPSQDNEP
jgi:hypothetical protein